MFEKKVQLVCCRIISTCYDGPAWSLTETGQKLVLNFSFFCSYFICAIINIKDILYVSNTLLVGFCLFTFFLTFHNFKFFHCYLASNGPHFATEPSITCLWNLYLFDNKVFFWKSKLSFMGFKYFATIFPVTVFSTKILNSFNNCSSMEA